MFPPAAPPFALPPDAQPDFIGYDASVQAPAPLGPYEDTKTLIALHERCKKECFDTRWVWEREWDRSIYYVIGRQWITYLQNRREWVNKRLHHWIPKPVTNKIRETLSAIRTTLGAVDLLIKARPLNNDVSSVATAEIVDEMAPLIHAEHNMDQVMRESDFWLIVTGNACLHVSWDLDKRSNQSFIPSEQCEQCGTVLGPDQIAESGNMCPTCGSNAFKPALDATGTPQGQWIPFGKGKTTALSPFEYAFPPNITRWDELPYIYRLRWRDRAWVEANQPEMVPKISWEKNSGDRSMQIFKALATTNTIGSTSQYTSITSPGLNTVEGVTEYELWYKPTPTYPQGLILRIWGDKSPQVVVKPDESIPGPMPYVDVNKKPLFPFVHAQFEHMGGCLYGSSAVAPIIEKQDQLNQLDSLIQLAMQRTANPAWVIPEGAGIDHLTGEPGLVIKWNPLGAAQNARPERIEGSDVPAYVINMRQQILQDIEYLSGAFDVLRGERPPAVEAFSALQLLVERSQSRFTSVFQARGEMYRDWFSVAIELERQYGPEQRIWTVVGPNKGYTFHHFENAQLQGAISILIEDGSNMPKTSLGRRAAIEQAMGMQLINPQDPEQRYALLGQLGLSELSPSLDIHVQTALYMQDAFEKWMMSPAGPPPLGWKKWHDPLIHYTERMKWLNTDRMRELLSQNPQYEMIVTQDLDVLQMMSAPPLPPDGGDGSLGGSAEGLQNSNRNSTSTGNLPSGNAETGPNVGPM